MHVRFQGKITAQGKLLLHGPLLVSELSSMQTRGREWQIFLFEQNIIFSEAVGKKTQFTNPAYIYKAHIQVRNQRANKIKGSFSCKRGFSLLNFELGLKKNYGLPNLETLCSYYSLVETATVLILCKNIESFLSYDCSKWDMLFSQR